MNEQIYNKVREGFSARFGTAPRMFRSPGRVNLIGEHTDYNEGFVLPAAIDKEIYLGIAPRTDNRLHLFSEEFGESFETGLDGLAPQEGGWSNYVLGVVALLRESGKTFPGFNLSFHGDVPIGSGLSSSAAVECATAFALNTVFDLGLNRWELAKLAQQAEHRYAGVMCGIMDQFASVFGKEGQVMKLDCRSLAFDYVPLSLQDYRIVLLNTNVKHSLASSAYNERRAQCEAGVAMVKEHFPEVQSLRDVTVSMLKAHVEGADELIYKRCRYVVEENQRLLEGVEALKQGDLHQLGQLMFQSHEGLSTAYEVSCPELDFLVDAVKNNPDVLGARMMGGGFGGCTINLIREDAIEELLVRVAESYTTSMHLPLTPYLAKTADGSTEIKD
jgi:galactokinase